MQSRRLIIFFLQDEPKKKTTKKRKTYLEEDGEENEQGEGEKEEGERGEGDEGDEGNEGEEGGEKNFAEKMRAKLMEKRKQYDKKALEAIEGTLSSPLLFSRSLPYFYLILCLSLSICFLISTITRKKEEGRGKESKR